MFKLLKITVLIGVVIAAGYVLLGLPFGPKTLYQHLESISNTHEAQALKTAIGQKVDDATRDLGKRAKKLAIDGVKQRLEEVTESHKKDTIDTLTKTDQQKLQSLIHQKEAAAPGQPDRVSLDHLIHLKNSESP